MDITKLIVIQEAIKEAEGVKNKLGIELTEQSNKIVVLQKQLVEMCTHPTTTRKTSYSSEGYDYRSDRRSWNECTICTTRVSNVKVDMGSFA